MEKLIKALQIFLKYKNLDYPTHCEHDVLYVQGYELDEISEDDIKSLKELGFWWSNEYDCFYSFKYGSC